MNYGLAGVCDTFMGVPHLGWLQERLGAGRAEPIRMSAGLAFHRVAVMSNASRADLSASLMTQQSTPIPTRLTAPAPATTGSPIRNMAADPMATPPNLSSAQPTLSTACRSGCAASGRCDAARDP